jgi:SHS2 domain-containing protein
MTASDGRTGIEYLDHTADVGIRARGPTLESVFRRAACALFSLMVDVEKIEPTTQHEANCRGETLADVLVEWMSDLLAQKDLSGLVFGRFEVGIEWEADEWRLRGSAWGEILDASRHAPRTEVKGISYLGLRVEQEGAGWVAECVLDV